MDKLIVAKTHKKTIYPCYFDETKYLKSFFKKFLNIKSSEQKFSILSIFRYNTFEKRN